MNETWIIFYLFRTHEKGKASLFLVTKLCMARMLTDNGGLQPSLQDAANGPRRSRAERAPAARSVRAQTESPRAERAHDLHEHDERLSGLVSLYVGSERPRAVLAPV